MSTCIEKLPHKCSDAHSSETGLQVFKDKDVYSGYCYSCSTYVPDPYGDRTDDWTPPKRHVKTDKEMQAELDSLANYPDADLRESRKLKPWALEYFGVKMGVSQADGETPVMSLWPYYLDNEFQRIKCKLLDPKKQWQMGKRKVEVDMFGWKQALSSDARTLIITEGEEDAVAVYQALKEKNKGTRWDAQEPAVVSLSSGASSAAHDLSRVTSDIRANFKEVTLVFDQDEAGAAAVKKALTILPHAQTVKLVEKDANAMVRAGRSVALAGAVLWKKAKPKNSRIITADDIWDDAMTPPKWGLSWPWKGLTALTRGLRFGEVYYWGAGVKMGKSELLNAIACHFIIEHGLDVFMCKPEEENKWTVKLMAGKVAGHKFHDPTVEFDEAAFAAARKLIGAKTHMLDLYQHVDWATLRQDIIYSAERLGCKLIFIDPITNLINGVPSSEANTVLQAISQELSVMAKDMDLAINIFCHLKAPDRGMGPPHEMGGKIYSSQFSGSRAMMRSCQYMLGLEGNKDPDLEIEERNTRHLVLLEDRIYGASGKIHLYWNDKTSLFSET